MKSVIRGAGAGAPAEPGIGGHPSSITKLVASPCPCQKPEGRAGACASPVTLAAWGLVPPYGAVCSVQGSA